MSVSPRTISRIINLSFKVTGLKEENAAINQLLIGINTAIRAYITLNLVLHALESSHPYIKVLLLGVSALSMISLGMDLQKQSKLSGGG